MKTHSNHFSNTSIADLYHENHEHLRNIRQIVYLWNEREYEACKVKCHEVIAYSEKRSWPCLWAKEMLANIHFFNNETLDCLKLFTEILETDPYSISARYYMINYFPSTLIRDITNQNLSYEDIQNLPKNWIQFLSPYDLCFNASVLNISDLGKIHTPTDPLEKASLVLAQKYKKEDAKTWFSEYYSNNRKLLWQGIEKSESFASAIRNEFKLEISIPIIFKLALIAKERDPFSIESQAVFDKLRSVVTFYRVDLDAFDNQNDTEFEVLLEAEHWLKEDFKI